jgi:hypothetical protein
MGNHRHRPADKVEQQHEFLGTLGMALTVGSLIAAFALHSSTPITFGIIIFVIVLAYCNNLG